MTGDTGTLRYMAPEVALNQPYNDKSDVYSFALIVWHLLTLQKPYATMSASQFTEQVGREGHRPPLDQSWPVELSSLLSRCWDADPACRPDFSEIEECLRIMINNR
eukprot:CAMPEP_0113947586 /NCGR_PEP_ID=MMETSP1339-20121228/65605_1 /TAXON_ID=94617 /ORGANISM="Fibrocapsa japonica" /LENGTH=105 /DNA_ID=CAMNT_0000954251 /DNA_START=20 /DNA_END=337 /DNA_ORIENTATION=+ /assembly_acc=CAM_ASM_000762